MGSKNKGAQQYRNQNDDDEDEDSFYPDEEPQN